jgi:hypothetical protein
MLNGTGAQVLDQGLRIIASETGEDVTRFHVNGAKYTLEIAKIIGVQRAYLKGGSPSCDRHGVTGEMLSRGGVKVIKIGWQISIFEITTNTYQIRTKSLQKMIKHVKSGIGKAINCKDLAISRWTPEPKVTGSNPVGDTFLFLVANWGRSKKVDAIKGNQVP